MGWFSSKPEPEEPEPPVVRLASDEFLSGLVMMAERYEQREKSNRESISVYAERLAAAESFNFGALDAATDEIRSAIDRALLYRTLASEIRDLIRDYEYRGYRPPYMPPPAQPQKPYQGGE